MTKNLDGGAMDPRVARVLIFYREAVAQATEKARKDLRQLGFDPDGPSLRIQRPR